VNHNTDSGDADGRKSVYDGEFDPSLISKKHESRTPKRSCGWCAVPSRLPVPVPDFLPEARFRQSSPPRKEWWRNWSWAVFKFAPWAHSEWPAIFARNPSQYRMNFPATFARQTRVFLNWLKEKPRRLRQLKKMRRTLAS